MSKPKIKKNLQSRLFILLTLLGGITIGTYLATNVSNYFLLNTFANSEIIFSDNFNNPRTRIHYSVPDTIPLEAISFSQECEDIQSLVLQNELDDHRLVEKNITPRTNILAQVNFFDDVAKTGAYVSLKDKAGYEITVMLTPKNNTYQLRLGNKQTANLIDTGIVRTQGWHKLELAATETGSYALIDNVSTATTLPDGRSGAYLKRLKAPSSLVLGNLGSQSRACFSEVVLRAVSPLDKHQ